MEFPLSSSPQTAGIFTFLIIAPLIIYYFFWVSIKPCKTKEPPVVGGAWPVIGHLKLLSGSQLLHITLGKMADKYGPIFTINFGVHRTLVVSNWEMAKECLTTNDKAFASRPNTLLMELLGYNQSMIGLSPYGSYWRQIRKIVTLELLSNHRLEMLKHVREGEVKAAIEGLHRQWINNNKSSNNNKLLVDMRTWFSAITMNVILKLLVGKRYVEYYTDHSDVEDDRESGKWRDAVRDWFELSGKFPLSDAVPFLRGWFDFGGLERKMKKTAKELDDVVQRWVDEHKRKRDHGLAKRHEDFMDMMLSVLDDQKDFCGRHADTVNKATIMALTLAASDTTLVTSTWTLSLLLNNPNVLKKAQDELDIHVGRDRQVTESDTKNLFYLQAIIKESLRLYPAAPLSVPHESVEDCTLNGYHIPAGTRLFVNVYKIHRDPRVWTDPYKFQPERFLTTHKHIDVRGQNFELLPFGSGRRMCPGITFAHQILYITLATLLHRFDIETPSNKPVDMSESSGLTNLKATPLEVLLTPRFPSSSVRSV